MSSVPRAGRAVLGAALMGLPPALSSAASVLPSPKRAQALVRAALVDLSRQSAFRTVRSAPSLRVVTVVEPRRHAEAATLRFSGPRGHGTVRSVVASGVEALRGDRAGWTDFLLQAGAPASAVAEAASLSGRWYSTPSAVRFGPHLGGIGHVLCVGSGCSLAGARATASSGPRRLSIDLPRLGGRLVVSLGAHPLPVEFDGVGTSSGVVLRFGYLRVAPPVVLPRSTAPLPPVLAG